MSFVRIRAGEREKLDSYPHPSCLTSSFSLLSRISFRVNYVNHSVESL